MTEGVQILCGDFDSNSHRVEGDLVSKFGVWTTDFGAGGLIAHQDSWSVVWKWADFVLGGSDGVCCDGIIRSERSGKDNTGTVDTGDKVSFGSIGGAIAIGTDEVVCSVIDHHTGGTAECDIA